MIEINDYASSNLFSVVSDNLGRTHSYGSPPIYYWYRNVVEEVKLIDDGFEIKEGSYRQPLEKSLGVVYYDVRHIGNDAVYIITDFNFNFRTIRSYLKRGQTTSPSRTTGMVAPLYTNPKKQIVSSYSIGHRIECCQFKDGTIRLQYKGRSIPLKSQFDKILSPFRRRKDGEYAIGEKNGVKYKLFVNDTTKAITESVYRQILIEDTIYHKDKETNIMKTNKKTVRLTEADLHEMVTEAVQTVIMEMVDEGQGWDLFKSVRNGYRNNEVDLQDYMNYKKTPEFKQKVSQFINHGTEEGNEEDTIYDRKRPDYATATDVTNPGWTGRINKSLRGKIGRAAGMAGARGYLGYQNLKNKFRK